jgi:hypothetical protein
VTEQEFRAQLAVQSRRAAEIAQGLNLDGKAELASRIEGKGPEEVAAILAEYEGPQITVKRAAR